MNNLIYTVFISNIFFKTNGLIVYFLKKKKFFKKKFFFTKYIWANLVKSMTTNNLNYLIVRNFNKNVFKNLYFFLKKNIFKNIFISIKKKYMKKKKTSLKRYLKKKILKVIYFFY